MISVDKITEIFCIIDDFCIEFSKAKSGHVLSEQTDKKRRKPFIYFVGQRSNHHSYPVFMPGQFPQSQNTFIFTM